MQGPVTQRPLAEIFHGTAVRYQTIVKHGGIWVEERGAWVFPDGSSGAYGWDGTLPRSKRRFIANVKR